MMEASPAPPTLPLTITTTTTKLKENTTRRRGAWFVLQTTTTTTTTILWKVKLLLQISWFQRVVGVGLSLLVIHVTRKIHRYLETVRLNRRSLSTSTTNKISTTTTNNNTNQNHPPPWWHGQNLTIWAVWIGDENHTPPPLIQAAMDTCKRVHENDPHLHYRLITNADLSNLAFDLHPSFWLLDNVERSDYLRGELLHHYGGFYMDTDMICLKNFRQSSMSPHDNNFNYFDVSAAQDRRGYGEWPSVSQNSVGPVRPRSVTTQQWHDLLWQTMDDITPQLKECLAKFGTRKKDLTNTNTSATAITTTTIIPYPTYRMYGTSMCGIPWGGVINFMKPIWKDLHRQQRMGHDMSMCDWNGRHLGWDGLSRNERCDIVHIGTSGVTFFDRKHWTIRDLCRELPVMRGSVHCRVGMDEPPIHGGVGGVTTLLYYCVLVVPFVLWIGASSRRKIRRSMNK